MTHTKPAWLLAVVVLGFAVPVRSETLLAVGTNWGRPKGDGYESQAVVFRNDGNLWQEANVPATATGYLRGVVYSAPHLAWAFGASGDDIPMLLKSADDGVSWTDI